MSPPRRQGNIKPLLQSILSTGYSQFELREFVELCYFLALPLLRRKIASGRLHPERLGMNEGGIVYDCLADIFQRDARGCLIQLEQYVRLLDTPVDVMSESEAFIALRRLVFGAVKRHLPRLYADLDPALGKILRNLKLAVERSETFIFATVFGETYLSARNLELHTHNPPWNSRELALEFSRQVTLNDNVPSILTKLYGIMLERTDIQRRVPVIAVALLIKETYALGWEQTDEERGVEESVERQSLGSMVETMCERVWSESRPTYVDSGKKSEQEYAAYLKALKTIMLAPTSEQHSDGSYFSILRTFLADMTAEEYQRYHRSVLEYMVKRTRIQLRVELGSDEFRERGGM